MKPLFGIALALLATGPLAAQDSTARQQPNARQQSIKGVGPIGAVQAVRENFQFTEGPAWDRQGSLYFSDIPANTIYRLSSEGEITSFLNPSGHANGLMVDGRGRLLACQMDGRVVAIDPESKQVTVLAEQFEGKRFNAPNDLVIDKSGGIYFTDPLFRAPEPLPQGTQNVYYIAPDKTVTRVAEDLPAPNGVALSTDESTLYVIPSRSAQMLAYAVQSPGKVGEKQVFCELKQPEGVQDSGGDGMAIDREGNLYITSALGVQVFSPSGDYLGVIETPQQPANVAFGGADNQTLYITARTGLYRCQMPIPGHVYEGQRGSAQR